jgi:hypothetical protein
MQLRLRDADKKNSKLKSVFLALKKSYKGLRDELLGNCDIRHNYL